MRKLYWLPALLLVLLAFLLPASAEPAVEITSRCKLTPGAKKADFPKAKDRKYKTYWSSGGGSHAWFEVTAPEGETCGYITVKWYDHPHAYSVQVPDGDDAWKTVLETTGEFLADSLALPEGTDRFRVISTNPKNPILNVDELYIYGAGDPPADCQLWESPADKADLLLIVAHPDDEVLWFGGTLPYYAGQRHKVCQVAMMTTNQPHRRLELLDALWTCGVRNYPAIGGFSDSFGSTLKKMYTKWNKNRVYRTIVGWVRQFKPDVLLTHDVKGEYGHGAHRVCADGVQYALKAAADPDKYPESAKEYDIWNVPKCYIHLYPENQLKMDWRQPLSAFGGKTGFDVAEEAFRCHVSQQKTDYHVEDWGPYDNSLFGLVRSLVGEDTDKNDFFENIDNVDVDDILIEEAE